MGRFGWVVWNGRGTPREPRGAASARTARVAAGDNARSGSFAPAPGEGAASRGVRHPRSRCRPTRAPARSRGAGPRPPHSPAPPLSAPVRLRRARRSMAASGPGTSGRRGRPRRRRGVRAAPDQAGATRCAGERSRRRGRTPRRETRAPGLARVPGDGRGGGEGEPVPDLNSPRAPCLIASTTHVDFAASPRTPSRWGGPPEPVGWGPRGLVPEGCRARWRGPVDAGGRGSGKGGGAGPSQAMAPVEARVGEGGPEPGRRHGATRVRELRTGHRAAPGSPRVAGAPPRSGVDGTDGRGCDRRRREVFSLRRRRRGPSDVLRGAGTGGTHDAVPAEPARCMAVPDIACLASGAPCSAAARPARARCGCGSPPPSGATPGGNSAGPRPVRRRDGTVRRGASARGPQRSSEGPALSRLAWAQPRRVGCEQRRGSGPSDRSRNRVGGDRHRRRDGGPARGGRRARPFPVREAGRRRTSFHVEHPDGMAPVSWPTRAGAGEPRRGSPAAGRWRSSRHEPDLVLAAALGRALGRLREELPALLPEMPRASTTCTPG
jgi:hypothetical protein